MEEKGTVSEFRNNLIVLGNHVDHLKHLSNTLHIFNIVTLHIFQEGKSNAERPSCEFRF